MAIIKETLSEGEKLLDMPMEVQYSAPQPQSEPEHNLIRHQIERPTGLTRKRAGFSSAKLSVNVDRLTEAGWYCHWINDTPGRIQEAIDLGYRFVDRWEVESTTLHVGADSADLGSKVARRVGTNENGTELLAYLMKTSQEFHAENMRMTQIPCDRIDAQIRSGQVHKSAGIDAEGNPLSSTDEESKEAFYRNVQYGTRQPR